MELVQRLEFNEEQVRADAEARLVAAGTESVDALFKTVCQSESPSKRVTDAGLRILATWERRSWTDNKAKEALEQFIRLARDPNKVTLKHMPLSPDSPVPFADAVRVLDVSTHDAAAYLRNKPGVEIGETFAGPKFDQRYYVSMILKREWVIEPRDWLYIANLPGEFNGKRLELSLNVVRTIPGDALVECLKNFRKSKDGRVGLFFQRTRINRESLHVLSSYSKITRFGANYSDDDIRDEDWAECIPKWPNIRNLTLLPDVGQKSIKAASNLSNLAILQIRGASYPESALQMFRDKEKMEVLKVVNMGVTDYLNQQGTGKWQME